MVNVIDEIKSYIAWLEEYEEASYAITERDRGRIEGVHKSIALLKKLLARLEAEE